MRAKGIASQVHVYTPPIDVLVWKTPELVKLSTFLSDPSDMVNSLLESSREALGLRVFWILGEARSVSVLLGLLPLSSHRMNHTMKLA